MNTYILYGLNHKTSPISVREIICKNIKPTSFKPTSNLELVTIFTCNRVEFYFYGSSNNVSSYLEELFKSQKLSIKSFIPYFYFKTSKDAIQHLFSVVSSLDSMVIGENQILHQVKESYKQAVQNNLVGKHLNLLFQKALYVGKKVRSNTGISSNSLSMATAIINLVQSLGLVLSNLNVLIIGAGEMANIVAKEFIKQNSKNLYFTNRTPEKASELASKYQGKTAKFEELPEILCKFDIIITLTSSNDYIITKDLLENSMINRNFSPVFIIDVSIPRNCDPLCSNIKNVLLYDLDKLNDYMKNKLFVNQSDIKQANEIIQEEVINFMQTLEHHKYAIFFKQLSLSTKQIKSSFISLFLKNISNTYKCNNITICNNLENSAGNLNNSSNLQIILENFANKITAKYLHETIKSLKSFINNQNNNNMNFNFFPEQNISKGIEKIISNQVHTASIRNI